VVEIVPYVALNLDELHQRSRHNRYRIPVVSARAPHRRAAPDMFRRQRMPLRRRVPCRNPRFEDNPMNCPPLPPFTAESAAQKARLAWLARGAIVLAGSNWRLAPESGSAWRLTPNWR